MCSVLIYIIQGLLTGEGGGGGGVGQVDDVTRLGGVKSNPSLDTI